MQARGAYYNDTDGYCAGWLKRLIAAGLIPDGDIDTRSIRTIQPNDLRGFKQVHLFAGFGGWPYALRIAGWPDERPVWTGSPPCQPFSVAGKGLGEGDSRHLWPDFFRLIQGCRPATVMGEQVAGAPGYAWFDRVASDMEAEGYACRAVDIPAAAVNAPHIRQRLYWVGHADDTIGRTEAEGRHVDDWAYPGRKEATSRPDVAGAWDAWIPLTAGGQRRRVAPSVPMLANGLSNRVPRVRAIANALVHPLAVEVIKAYMEAYE